MKIRYIIASALLIYINVNLLAQKAEKGFKSLEKNDVIKAQEIFSRIITEDSTNCAAQFGMSIVLSHETNQASDYFQAWDHFLLAKKYLTKLNEEDNVYLKEFFTYRDTERRNKSVQYNLEIEEKIIEDKLIKYVREENNLAVAEKFITVYPNSKFYENVVHIRNHLEFRKAEKVNTLEAYNTFLSKYPHAAQLSEATIARNELAYQKAFKENTISAYEDYLLNYPKAYHYYDAVKRRDQLAFDYARKQNTIEAFDVFVIKYPNSLHIPEAKVIQRKLLYEKARQVNTLDAYNDFISRYPDGEFFIDIFNLKTNVLGVNMLADAQGNKEVVKWAKGFDWEEKNDSAGGISLTADNRIIVSGTRNRSLSQGTEAWVISVDSEGKILWNKAFGSKQQNRVKFQTLTPKGDILIGGWNGSCTDTIFRKAWLFEVSSTGNGKWERNVDGRELESVFLTPSGEKYVSGYNSTDSLSKVLYLSKLNSDYQKLWSREYIRPGILCSFAVTQAQNLLMGAGTWLWKTDSQGYIQWEKVLPASDSIISINSITGGIFYFTGARNNAPYIAKINDQGTISWEKNFSDMGGLHFDFAASMPDKNILVRLQGDNQLGFMVLTEKGEILKEIRFVQAQAPVFGSVILNSSGEIFTVFTKKNFSNSEIVVCKLIMK